MLLGLVAVTLVLWLEPLRSHRLDAAPTGARAAVEDGRLHPEFLRVAVDGCVAIANLDAAGYEIAHADPPGRLEGDAVGRFCFPEPGVHRLPIDGRPFHGGFVIVDPQAGASGEDA
jgi:hypothetical protein